MAKPIHAIRCNQHDLVEFSQPKNRHRYASVTPKVPAKRSGLTLIEMLVSVALSLLVVLAIVRIFEVLGTTVTDSRAILEMSAQLRTVANQLQDDLDRMTAEVTPPLDPNSASGFFEIIEGPDRDKDPKWGIQHDMEFYDGEHINVPDDQIRSTTDVTYNNKRYHLRPSFRNWNANNLDPDNPFPFFDAKGGWYGDLDDVLMFTIASDDKPFVGRFNNRLIKSNQALVAWWVERLIDETGTPRMFRLHRRLLLIRPDLAESITDLEYLRLFRWLPENPEFRPVGFPPQYYGINTFTNENDLAVRPPTVQELENWTANGRDPHPVPCTLEDLAIRQNRFGHVATFNNRNDVNDPDLLAFPNSVSIWDDLGGNNDLVANILPRSIEKYCRPNPNIAYDLVANKYTNKFSANQPYAANMASAFHRIHGLFSKRLAYSPRPINPNARPIQYNQGFIDLTGDDVMLTDVLAFDIRVYDPEAPGQVISQAPARSVVLYPSDPGYDISLFAGNYNLLASAPRGAFVDLYSAYNNFSATLHQQQSSESVTDPYYPNANRTPQSIEILRADIDDGEVSLGDFFAPPQTPTNRIPNMNSPLNQTYGGVLPVVEAGYERRVAVYDTWSTYYDRDGIAQGDPPTTTGGFSTTAYQETNPPYSAPLRGIEVTIRALDQSSQQVRQVSVVSDF